MIALVMQAGEREREREIERKKHVNLVGKEVWFCSAEKKRRGAKLERI